MSSPPRLKDDLIEAAVILVVVIAIAFVMARCLWVT